jgi:hypothetical protein
MKRSPSRRKQVLLFGTSGNPPTGSGGHGGIVQYFSKTGIYTFIKPAGIIAIIHIRSIA